jgi:hypothetical protein
MGVGILVLPGVRNVVKQVLLQEDMPVIIQADKEAEHGIFEMFSPRPSWQGRRK